MPKKMLAAAAAFLVVIMMVLAGCGGDDPEKEMNETAGTPNPWSDAATAEEAAKGAGIGTFTIADDMKIGDETLKPENFRYMKGMAEASVPFGAVEMTVRKGTDALTDVAEGDISGDYTNYEFGWTEDVDGIEVACYGNREGEASKTLWSSDKYYYSIVAHGVGGDGNYGLPQENVAMLVKGIK